MHAGRSAVRQEVPGEMDPTRCRRTHQAALQRKGASFRKQLVAIDFLRNEDVLIPGAAITERGPPSVRHSDECLAKSRLESITLKAFDFGPLFSAKVVGCSHLDTEICFLD